MNFVRCAVTAALGVAGMVWGNAPAISAEVKVMAGSALAGVIKDLAPGFEQATSNRIAAQYGLSRTFQKQIDAGEWFDLAILSVDTMDNLTKQGKLARGPLVAITRAGVGVVVRKGAPKPDINSVDAFRSTLLGAKSISYAPRTESGEHIDRVFERLGVADQIKAKLKPQQVVDRVAHVVAEGEAELGMTVTSLLQVPGVEVVGKIPEDLQLYLIFTAGIGRDAKQPDAARALIKHLTAPTAAPVITARGWEPAPQ